MAEHDFDLFTIGAGSGGVAASRRAASYGARVAICEDDRIGGTCVNRGCVPKKLLVYGSELGSSAEEAHAFGWSPHPSRTHDWPALIGAVNREVSRLNDIYTRMLRDAGVTFVSGRGRIVDAHTVEVGGKTYTAKYILVATGGKPFVPEIPGREHGITSDGAFLLPERPQRIVIIGGGYIGVEFAGIFRGLGSEVTLLIRGDTVLRGFDHDVCATLTTAMLGHGIKIQGETFVRDITARDGALSAMTSSGDTLAADCVMFATGRVPNVADLGLAEAGVKLDASGAVVVDEYSRTSVESIYAVGDVTNRLNLTPVAIAEGRAFAETTFNDRKMTVLHAGVASAVFSQPPVAAAGLTEQQARALHVAVDVYVTNFRPMKHTLTGREERVMMKLIIDRSSQRLLGVHVVGADGPEMVQGLAAAMRCGITKDQLDTTIGIHPSSAEEFFTMRNKRPDPPG